MNACRRNSQFMKIVALCAIASISLIAAPVYESLPSGEMRQFDLTLHDYPDRGDVRILVRCVGNTVTAAAIQSRSLRIWEQRIAYLATSDGLSGEARVWENDRYNYPIALDVSIAGDEISGAYTLKKADGFDYKAAAAMSAVNVQGSVTGVILSESDMRSKNAVAENSIWDSWVGPNSNFSASANSNAALLDNLGGARLVWRSEFIAPPEHGSCRYGPRWYRPHAGAGASPVLYGGKLYVMHAIPTGNEFLSCMTDDTANGKNDDPEYYQRLFGIMNLSEQEKGLPYRVSTDELVSCIDAATGKTLWRTRFPDAGLNLFDHKAGLTNHTPAIGDGRLYVFGALGIVRCLDTESGELQWSTPVAGYNGNMESEKQKALANESISYLSRSLTHGLQYIGGVVVAPTGLTDCGLMGIDGETGDSLWNITDRILGSKATPLKWEKEGNEYIIACGNGTKHRDENNSWVTKEDGPITCIDPSNGDILWQIRDAGDNEYQCALHGDIVVTRAGGYRMSLTGATKLWDSPCLPNAKANALIANDIAWFLCSDDGNSIQGMDLQSGEQVVNYPFSGGRNDEGGFAAMSGRLLIDPSTQHGTTQYFMFPAKRDDFALMGPEWVPPHPPATAYATPISHPVGDGRMFIRGLDGIYCYDIRKDGASTKTVRKIGKAVMTRYAGATIVKRRLHIRSRNAAVSVSVLDSQGRQVAASAIAAGASSSIDLAGYGAGVYLVMIQAGRHQTVERFAIQ